MNNPKENQMDEMNTWIRLRAGRGASGVPVDPVAAARQEAREARASRDPDWMERAADALERAVLEQSGTAFESAERVPDFDAGARPPAPAAPPTMNDVLRADRLDTHPAHLPDHLKD